jgi:hypothetical protein
MHQANESRAAVLTGSDRRKSVLRATPTPRTNGTQKKAGTAGKEALRHQWQR